MNDLTLIWGNPQLAQNKEASTAAQAAVEE